MGRRLKAVGRSELAVLCLAALSGILYLVLHQAQDTLLNHARMSPGAIPSVWDEPANRSQFLLVLSAQVRKTVVGSLHPARLDSGCDCSQATVLV